MKTKYKVLIAMAIIALLGLIGFLVYRRVKFRNNKTYAHKRTKNYRPPNQELVHKRINEEFKRRKQSQRSAIIPKVVYMTYDDIDAIPPHVLENIKRNCQGYKIEIHGDQSCEDFLYEYYGPDAMQIFREIKIGAHKADFWRYCILYAKGGYYFDIKTNFKKHIDDVFKISRQREWFTVLCDKKQSSCIYNGIIITPPKNPILWDALLHFYTHINVSYLTHVHCLFKLLDENCPETLRIGSNTQKNGWRCTILTEKCTPCVIDQECSKHKGQNCSILDQSGREAANVEPNFPWNNSYTVSPTRLLIMDGNKRQAVRSKPCITIAGSFQHHYECVGFLLDTLGENYEIHVYHNDRDGFIDLFSRTYEFKSFELSYSNIDMKKYVRYIILSSDDPITFNNPKLTTRIIHRGGATHGERSESLKFTPLVLADAKYILPVYHTAFTFSWERSDQIVYIGDPSKSSREILSFLAENTTIPIVHFSRVPINNINPRIKNVVNAKASVLEKEVGQSKFMFINHCTDRFSGAIAIALSCKTPMIIDSYQAGTYKFPAFVYTDANDLVSKLREIGVHEYKNLHKQVVDFTDSLLMKNRTICPEFARGSFTLVEVKNREGKLDWNGKIPRSVFQTHEHRWVPKGMAASMESLRASAPAASYTFYDKDERREYIKKYYPSALEPYDSLVPGAYRCDMFRYIRLYNEGGVYFDSPYSVPSGLAVFNDIVHEDDEFIASWDMPIIEKRKIPAVAQGFIASIPKHPILHAVIEGALNLIRRREYADSPLAITGPIMMGKVMEKMRTQQMKGVRMFRHVGGEIHYEKGLVIRTRYPKYDMDRAMLEKGLPRYSKLWDMRRVYRDLRNPVVMKSDNRSTVTKRGGQIIKKYKGDRRSERYHREKKFYTMLTGTGITPSLINYDDLDFVLVLEDAGEPLNQLHEESIPKDYISQSLHIMNLLEDMNIAHNDLWSGNILVKDGKLKIIDFEHSTQLGEVPRFFRNDNLLDMTSVFSRKGDPLYLGTTETLQEIVSLCMTPHTWLSGTTTLCSVVGDCQYCQYCRY